MLTLSLFDPAGWRGSGHRHGTQHEINIGRDTASPGYVAGPLPVGTWQVVVDTHMIMPGTQCTIRVEVSTTETPDRTDVARSSAVTGEQDGASVSPTGTATHAQGGAAATQVSTIADRSQREATAMASEARTLRRGPGWYRGDLHAHSIHSDAAWDIPDLLAWARERKLDFQMLSDHNTISGLAQMDASSGDDLLTMGGMEFTTFWGHALALGIRQWVDWRVTTDAGPTSRAMTQMPAEVEAIGGLFIIAHPMAVGDPYCTGCQWRYPTMTPGTATAVEVWNSDWRSESRNELGLSLAYEWLNAGHRLALTAGTDNHGRHPEEVRSPGGHDPTMHYGFNVVYAEDRSEREILRAVRVGHLYISSGPMLELSAAVGERQAMMGDVLDVPRGQSVQVTASWGGCPEEAEVCLVVDGLPRFAMPAGNEGTQTWSLQGGEARWCLLTLRAADGLMLALTNPIFLKDEG